MSNEHLPTSLPLKVMIHKNKQQVVFAEANADFIDTLLSFLTLPLGTVIKVLRSHHYPLAIGCTNNLYESIESLDPDMFQTPICKTMLLHPQNAERHVYRSLDVKVDQCDWGDPKLLYVCPDKCHCSFYEHTVCSCGKAMTDERGIIFPIIRTPGVFIDERAVLLIDNDMRLLPISTTTVVSLIQAAGLTNQSEILEEKVVNIEVFELLVNVLFSKTPLTDLVFSKKLQQCNFPPKISLIKPKEEVDTDAERNTKTLQVKLIIRKSERKVLYAEAAADFVDLLFSFLTIPTGTIVKLLGQNTPLRSFSSISCSIKDLSIGKHFKSNGTKGMLLNPKLAPYFMCDSQLLDLVEKKYPFCFVYNDSRKEIDIINPKKSGLGASSGGKFVKESQIFMITDDLVVKTLSSTAIINLLHGLKFPICDVEEKVVRVGKHEALNLLKASLGSTSALTEAFSYFIGSS